MMTMKPRRDSRIGEGQKYRPVVLAFIGVFYLSGLPALGQTAAVTAPVAPAAVPVGAQPITPAVQPAQLPPLQQTRMPTPPDSLGGVAAIPASQPLDETALLAIADAKRHVRDGTIMPDENFPTLFFTAWQHALLQEAKIGFNTRLPQGELGSGADKVKKDPGIREISLGGIAFSDATKWTVWLNGVRVTPHAIPDQILDIKVSQGYIDLKWFDNYTNKIYPIRLRPQERFNLDSRIFLPGTGVLGAM